jgi:hypothetical protein
MGSGFGGRHSESACYDVAPHLGIGVDSQPAAGWRCGKVLRMVFVRKRVGPKVAGTLRVPSAQYWTYGNFSYPQHGTEALEFVGEGV